MLKTLINEISRGMPVRIDGRFHRLSSPFSDWIGPDAGPSLSTTPYRHLFKASSWYHGVDPVLVLRGLRKAFCVIWIDWMIPDDNCILVAGAV
ncbi:hypothetical protein HW561_22895 [Rhodobacteraceae bacterium B1Z28]|uniref:Uncharacterized protein n=1 Tax=Ruegeria haliotis TaxID=2747601 RepID=A0ABX2PWP8_9RHOB|nr:hypothetical protein [Ruegeria haliotis]NVO58628.1 hypothetical protein [Ruegeria haliotis]